jgi:hypothetical protein
VYNLRWRLLCDRTEVCRRGVSKKQKGVTIMCNCKRLYYSAVLSLVFVVACSSVPPAQTALTTLQGDQGGMIIYGLVDGATTPAMAMARILHNVQNTCGEKPQVGKVFRVRGTNSDAIFLTVVNHSMGNKPRAGLLIAAPSGPQQVEIGFVIDDAARFASTMNPLQRQLFSVWHPGGEAAPAGKASAGGGGALPPMQTASLADSTATVSLPAGWNIDPWSKGGTAVVNGPQGEKIALNLRFMGQDPRAPGFQSQMRMGVKPLSFIVIYPYNADMTRAFPDLFQRMRATAGAGPAPLKIDSVKPVDGSQGQCVNATGQVNADGKTMRELGELLCRSQPDQKGQYSYIVSQYQLPLGATDRQRAISAAIMASYRVDEQRVQAGVATQTAQFHQIMEVHTQALEAFTQQQIAHTQQIGAETMARARQADAEHDAQHAQWRQGEDNISRQGQGFSNYILDQTVVQDNNMYNNGTIGHGTLWNNEADALVKANPNRFEYVPTPNYWRGTDYVP